MKRLVWALLLVVLLLLLFSSVSRVGGEERAVLDPRFGEPEVWSPGIHFRVPLLTRVTWYPLAPQRVESQVKVDTRDNLNFHIRYTLTGTFDPDTLLSFHARRAGRPLESTFRQLSDELVQKAAAHLRADEILATATGERWMGALAPPARERGLKPLEIKVAMPESRAIVNAALIYQERNLPLAALQLVQKAVERAPQDAILRFGRGRILELQGRQKEAEEEYVQALFLDPVSQPPMSRLVGALLKRKEFERARRLLTAALAKDRTSAPHLNWLGVTLQLEANYDEARLSFEKAIEVDPKNAEYRANLGALLLVKKDYPGAAEALKEALKINPNFTLALYNLGVALALEGKAREAIPFFERAAQSGPPAASVLNALARSYQDAGQTAKAIATLQRSLQIRPEQPEQEKLLRQLQGRSPSRSAKQSR